MKFMLLKVMAANGSPAPLFEPDDERCAFVIRLPVHTQAQVTSPLASMDVTDQVSDEVAKLLTIAAVVARAPSGKSAMSERREVEQATGLP